MGKKNYDLSFGLPLHLDDPTNIVTATLPYTVHRFPPHIVNLNRQIKVERRTRGTVGWNDLLAVTRYVRGGAKNKTKVYQLPHNLTTLLPHYKRTWSLSSHCRQSESGFVSPAIGSGHHRETVWPCLWNVGHRSQFSSKRAQHTKRCSNWQSRWQPQERRLYNKVQRFITAEWLSPPQKR